MTPPTLSEASPDLPSAVSPEHPTRVRLVGFTPALTLRRLLGSVFRQDWLTGVLCLGLDVAGWLAIYGLAVSLRDNTAYDDAFSFLTIHLLGLTVIVLTLFVVGGYDRRTDMRSLGYTSEHILALTAAVGVASLLIYSVAAFGYAMRPSRGALWVSFVTFVPVSLAYRRFVSRLVAVNMAHKTFLVLGAGEIARRFYEAYGSSTNRQRLRFVDLGEQRVGQPILGEGSPRVEGNAAAHLEALGPESSGVILAEELGRLRPELLERLVRLHFQKTPVYTLESFYETHWRRVPVHTIDPVWPLQMGFGLARNSPYAQFKRVCDVVASGGALLLLGPVFALLALLTWWDSGRPVIFRQPRVGRDDRVFTILKFRTMHHRPPVAADAPLTPDELYTRPGDRRITRLGHWLRKLRLDELPQLWNVFKGDMSLIGPRAEWTKCAERYEQSIPSYHFRHLVKPGITGWAQVNYPYGESDEDAFQKLKYDLYYIRHYSLKLDAMITLKTLHIMLFGKGQ